MKLLNPLSVDAVIAEFLKAEFYQVEYDHDRERFQQIVLQGDLSDKRENTIRRALLFRRRNHMWRELPEDTQWYAAQIEAEDIDKIRVFPRAQWRRISDGSFFITDIADRIRRRPARGRQESVISKIQLLRYRLQHEPYFNSVLLIGLNDKSLFTILEGNHRMAAALLVSPQLVQTGFRVLCGLSPHMRESCWYETNIKNLWRYFKNRMRYMFDHEADVEYMLRKLPAAPVGNPRILSAAADAEITPQPGAVECLTPVSGRRTQ